MMRHRFLWMIGALAAGGVAAQPLPSGDPLHAAMVRFDARLFGAFNECRIEEFQALLATDVEFFHDQAGPARGASTIAEQVRKNICGKVRRELTPGSLAVYPMKGYGALVIGRHRFFAAGRNEPPTGEAQFVHLVQSEGDGWRLSRVMSFDHVPLPRP